MKPFKFSKKKREYIKWSKNVTEVRIFPKTHTDAAAAAPLNIDMDDLTAQGIYSNMAAITHTETEFIFDFLFLQHNQPKARVRARVISSPLHTKRLIAALRDNLKTYEARFGAVKES